MPNVEKSLTENCSTKLSSTKFVDLLSNRLRSHGIPVWYRPQGASGFGYLTTTFPGDSGVTEVVAASEETFGRSEAGRMELRRTD